jgi:hypothetical protein
MASVPWLLMRAIVSLTLAALLALAFSMAARGAPSSTGLRVECDMPGSLRLHRFEDGSARLECAGRTLVRVSVPG